MFIISGQTVISVILEFRNKRTLWRICGKKRDVWKPLIYWTHEGLSQIMVVSWRQRLPTVAFAGTMTHWFYIFLSALSLSLSMDMSCYCKSQKKHLHEWSQGKCDSQKTWRSDSRRNTNTVCWVYLEAKNLICMRADVQYSHRGIVWISSELEARQLLNAALIIYMKSQDQHSFFFFLLWQDVTPSWGKHLPSGRVALAVSVNLFLQTTSACCYKCTEETLHYSCLI